MKIDDGCFFVSTKDVVTIKLGIFFFCRFSQGLLAANMSYVPNFCNIYG